jgi:hypothetical protein
VLGSTGAAAPFYGLTFSATKSVSLLQASYAGAAAKARGHGDTAAADEFEAKVKAVDDAAVETAAQVIGLAEEHALFVRTGHHSAHTGEFRDGAGAMAALFPQNDNSNGEPNLHVHTVLLNRALRDDQDTSGDRKWRGSGWQAKPAQPRNVNRWFDARCKRYGVRRITVHDTRPACGSLLAALDVHPRVAMAILRHGRMAMTMEIYPTRPPATR